jgi:AP2-like factor, ANT lineage
MRGSELSALVAEPKLEDFLGGISFSEQNHKASCTMIPSSSSACYATSGISAGYPLQFADSVMVASLAGVHDGSGMLSAATADGGAAAANSNNGGSIGLSMIKNWLRSQPAPPQPAADGVQAAQGLSLSMNMAGPQGAVMPLVGERGREPETVSTTSVQGVSMAAARKEDSSGGSGGAGALVPVSTPDTGGSGEAVARKTVDTFGQRTSIYRGVTR